MNTGCKCEIGTPVKILSLQSRDNIFKSTVAIQAKLHLTGTIFETGPYGVLFKSQNPPTAENQIPIPNS